MGKHALNAVEEGLSHTAGYAEHGRLEHPADAVPLRARRFDHGAHGVRRPVVENGERSIVKSFDIRGVISERAVVNPHEGANMRPDEDALRLEHAAQDASRRRDGRGQPAGEMPAAAVVLKSPVAEPGGEVGVTGAGDAIAVIPAPRVVVRDHDRDGRARGHPAEDPAFDHKFVRLAPRGGKAVRGPSEIELVPHRVLVHRDARGEPVEHDADRGSVALAEYRH